MIDRATMRELKLWMRLTDARGQELFYASNKNAFIIITKECTLEEIESVAKEINKMKSTRDYLGVVCNIAGNDGEVIDMSIENQGNEYVARAGVKK